MSKKNKESDLEKEARMKLESLTKNFEVEKKKCLEMMRLNVKYEKEILS